MQIGACQAICSLRNTFQVLKWEILVLSSSKSQSLGIAEIELQLNGVFRVKRYFLPIFAF